eukprot:maker-scaffold352_size199037-snap-gene-0.45 protein:Tk08721 transcript:maker-scaffold352_size199037-snap-gene-0.45-mRNA-1 annotation:"Aquaporin-12A"
MGLVPCIVVSILYIVVSMFLGEVCRKLAVGLFQPGSLVLIALKEFIAAAEMCACAFELIIIADNYGVLAYSIFLFLLTIWWSDHWDDATACPYVHFEACLQGSMSVVETVVRTVAETAGALTVFRYVQFLWSFEFAETHVGRPHSLAFDKCSSDLQVPVMYGALIEGVATMLCRLTSKLLAHNEPRYANAIDSFIATALVVAAFDYSGGYYNPVLATGLKYGCRGHDNQEHFVVYWLGASLGAIASIYVYPLLHRLLGKNTTTLPGFDFIQFSIFLHLSNLFSLCEVVIIWHWLTARDLKPRSFLTSSDMDEGAILFLTENLFKHGSLAGVFTLIDGERMSDNSGLSGRWPPLDRSPGPDFVGSDQKRASKCHFRITGWL